MAERLELTDGPSFVDWPNRFPQDDLWSLVALLVESSRANRDYPVESGRSC
jgi:hypothetical protein